MKGTAVIVFTLLGSLLLLKECGNSDVEKRVTNNIIPEEEIQISDTSYVKRDSEIALASYTKSDVSTEVTPVIHHAKTDTKEREIVPVPKLIEAPKSSEPITLKIEEIKVGKPIKVEVTESNVSQPIEVKVVELVKKIDLVLPSVDKVVELAKITTELPTVSVVKPIEATTDIPIPVKAIELKKPVSVESNLPKVPLAEDIVVPKSTEEIVSVENIKVPEDIEKAISIEHIVVPKTVKVIEENSSVETIVVSQAIKALDMEKVELRRAVEERTKSEKLTNKKVVDLKEQNRDLNIKISKLLNYVEALKKKSQEEKSKAETFKIQLNQEMTRGNQLESNLTNEIEKKFSLQSEKAKLEGKITELLTIAKKATDRATLDQEAKTKEFKFLTNQYENLESNLSAKADTENLLQNENSQLKTKITEMLRIAKEATEKATIEHEAEAKEFQSLLANYSNLESNLTSEINKDTLLQEEKVELEAKIEKMLTIAKKATD